MRLAGMLLIGLCGLAATLLGALPGVAAGLLLLLDYSLGGSLDMVRGLIAALPWPGGGVGLLHRQSLLMHPVAAGLWSLAAASLGLTGTAMALAEWREGRPDWRAAPPAWALAALCGGGPVTVLLAPAMALQLVGLVLQRHAARLPSATDSMPDAALRVPALPRLTLDPPPAAPGDPPDAGRLVAAARLPAGDWRTVSVADPERQRRALALLGAEPVPGEHLALFHVHGDGPGAGQATAALLQAAALHGLALRPLSLARSEGLAEALALPSDWHPVAYLVPALGAVPVLQR